MRSGKAHALPTNSQALNIPQWKSWTSHPETVMGNLNKALVRFALMWIVFLLSLLTRLWSSPAPTGKRGWAQYSPYFPAGRYQAPPPGCEVVQVSNARVCYTYLRLTASRRSTSYGLLYQHRDDDVAYATCHSFSVTALAFRRLVAVRNLERQS
jgi:hypothetical protein